MTVASSLPVHIYCEDEYGLYDELTVFTDSSGYYIAEIHEDTVSYVRAVGINTYGYHEYFDNITLNASEVNVKDIELSEKAVLRVTAVGTDGSPLDDVYFSVMNDEIYREMYGPYGNATFAVEEGEIHLTASKESYAEYHETLNITEEFSDHTVTMIRMGLPSGLEGHVTDARTGEPVANAQVTVGSIHSPSTQLQMRMVITAHEHGTPCTCIRDPRRSRHTGLYLQGPSWIRPTSRGYDGV